MPREGREQYEQDRLGNVNRKLDTLRAQEGMKGADDEEGIAEITSADTGSLQLLYSLPTHVSRAILTELHATNTQSTAGFYSLYEVDLDGSGNITGNTRRSVPLEVTSQATRINSYEGLPFEKAVAVDSDFEGFVGAGFVVDHDEEDEPSQGGFST